MVERALSMREVAGSMPASSSFAPPPASSPVPPPFLLFIRRLSFSSVFFLTIDFLKIEKFKIKMHKCTLHLRFQYQALPAWTHL